MADLDEAIEVIEIIKRIIEENKCQFIVLCGDINTDFRRRTGQVDLVRDAIEQLHLLKAWDKYMLDFTRVCYRNENNVTTSVLDHFFLLHDLATPL